jgi:hypothetical protein
MPIDNLFINDLTLTTPTELADAMVSLARSGIEEKFRLDFKAIWQPERQCTDIAAFANSYGGLVVIGVSDDRQLFHGTPSPKNSDLKTQISSVIAARIAPVPMFEVHTCPAPDNAANRLVLIRISPQPRLHLYLKSDRPVYVRNEDGTIPAAAPQLQALLDRVRNAEVSQMPLPNPLQPIAGDFYPTKATEMSDRLTSRHSLDQRMRSEAYLQIGVVPERLSNLAIDAGVEQQFKQLIYRSYPSIDERRQVDLGHTILEYEDRRNSWSSFRHRDLDRDHEVVWAFDSRGIVQCVFEIADRVGNGPANLWSLVDLFISLQSTLRLAHEFWQQLGVYGGGQVAARLEILKLTPFRSNGLYMPLFYRTEIQVSASVVEAVPGPYPVSTAETSKFFSYDDLATWRRRSSVFLGSQLLRDLRFSANADRLAVELRDEDTAVRSSK